MLNPSAVRCGWRESVSLGHFQNCNLLKMDHFRNHGVEDEPKPDQQSLAAVHNPFFASQRLNGSALGEGMDWISRRTPWTFRHWSLCTPPSVSKGSARGGTNCPPFEDFCQRGIAATQLLQVIGRSGRVRQRADNVGENKPLLLIVKDPAHRPFFEKRHIAHWKTFPSSLRSANRVTTICVPISH